MADMHRAGKTNAEIAAAFHCTNKKVATRLAKVGITASGSMRRRIREEHGDEVMFLGDLGYTADEIGDRLGVSSSLIRTVFKELGYTPPKRNTSRMHEKFVKETKAEAEKMREMAESGMTDAEIAVKFGVCKSTVRARIKRTGMVRGNDRKHAQFVERIADEADGLNMTIIGEPSRRSIVVMCNECGTVRDIEGVSLTPCPECRRREIAERNEVRRIEREKRRAERMTNAKLVQMRRLVTLLTPRTCPRCGKVFHSTNPRVVYCTEECSKREWSSGSIRKRIRKYGGVYQQGITLGKLVARDGLTCYICGKTCDWNDRRWGNLGPDYPTIDHVVPLAKGGGHKWENVRVACARCNSDKRDIDLGRVLAGRNFQPPTAAASRHTQTCE